MGLAELELEVEAHEKGSPEWRDANDKLFDHLVENPDDWSFTHSGDQIRRIREAHAAYVAEFMEQGQTTQLPGIDLLRQMMTREFQDAEGGMRVQDLTKFWDTFTEDMPPVLRDQNHRHSLAVAWIDRKMKAILLNLKLRFIDWEQKDLTCNLQLPESLRSIADGLEELTGQGFALYLVEREKVEDVEFARYYLRKAFEVTS